MIVKTDLYLHIDDKEGGLSEIEVTQLREDFTVILTNFMNSLTSSQKAQWKKLRKQVHLDSGLISRDLEELPTLTLMGRESVLKLLK